VEPPPKGGVTSLQVNTVQIEMDEDGRLLYVWGYCPHESWDAAMLTAPAAKLGRLQYIGRDVVPGVSISLNADRHWGVGHDSTSRWLCIGDGSARGEMVAFAPGAIAVLKEGELIALWLHPEVRG
jgi:hypothetical protein